MCDVVKGIVEGDIDRVVVHIGKSRVVKAERVLKTCKIIVCPLDEKES